MNQIRPNTGAGMITTNYSSSSVMNNKQRTQSTKRNSRNNLTLQAHTTLDSSLVQGDGPRFSMYNKNLIRDQDKRRVRRAQSNIRPRQRFSTITAFHKNDVGCINPQQEEGITPKSSKYKEGAVVGSQNNACVFLADQKFYNATAQWSANVNLNLDQATKKTRSFPI